ncbi:MAG TPA: RIO1 family regulatory kinase/ATPase [Methanomicrobiales archaeon]|nr:RIO1 family regulatory kinase/ATPase [Methanomicrobiales archaeon]
MPISAEAVRTLQENDLLVLHTLERLMKRYQWVPLEVLSKATGKGEKEVSYRLTRLLRSGMAKYEKVPYEGYSLVFAGYDALALHALSVKGTVSALGPFIGEGKESLVYEGLGLGRLVLKFHRIGQRSFHSARLKRGYMPEEGHTPWIFASTLSAEREYLALTKLHPWVSVPVPIERNRHVVVMSLIPGEILSRCTPPDPGATLDAILLQAREAYRLGVVHADLSEFNVMIDGDRCYLIDWPQWMEADHPNAGEILERDLKVILDYFARKYGIEYSLARALSEVTG